MQSAAHHHSTGGRTVKRFACRDVIPGCDRIFTGADDQSVLDQVVDHAAADHGLLEPPLALVELVVATTYTVPTTRSRNHLRLLGAPADPAQSTHPLPQDERASISRPPRRSADVLAFPTGRRTVDAASAAPAPQRHTQVAEHDSYRHECLFYRGADDFVTELVPFIRDGLALDQPVMVAVIEPHASALRTALGPDAESVSFIDMAILGSNPARIIPAWQSFTAEAAGRPTRGIGEPIWAGRRPAEIAEGQFHEALLNMSPDEATPLWLVCPYDIDALDPAVIAEARRSHPFHTGTHGGTEYSGTEYRGAEHAEGFFTAPLPEPEGPVTWLAPDRGSDDVATQLLQQAGDAGLSSCASARLATAVDAVTSAATDGVSVRVWRETSTLVCQIDDPTTHVDPLVGRSRTLAVDGPERGIRLANELCDLVQVRSGAGGTSVRLYSWL